MSHFSQEKSRDEKLVSTTDLCSTKTEQYPVDFNGVSFLLVMIWMIALSTKTVYELVGNFMQQIGVVISSPGFTGGIVVHIIQILFTWLFIIRHYNLSWKTFGFRKPKRQDWIFLIGWFFISILVSAFVLYLTFSFLDIGSSKANNMETAGFLLSILMTTIIAPIEEELGFRGVIYVYLKSRLGTASGIVISALIFGLNHAPSWEQVPNAIAMGMIFAFVYERTGSLWMPIILHGLLNALTVGLFFLSKLYM